MLSQLPFNLAYLSQRGIRPEFNALSAVTGENKAKQKIETSGQSSSLRRNDLLRPALQVANIR